MVQSEIPLPLFKEQLENEGERTKNIGKSFFSKIFEFQKVTNLPTSL